MFWSSPEMYEQYINQALSSDEDEDHGDNGDATDDHDHDHDQSVSEDEWVPSSDDSPEPVSWGGRVGGWESHIHTSRTPVTHSLTHTLVVLPSSFPAAVLEKRLRHLRRRHVMMDPMFVGWVTG